MRKWMKIVETVDFGLKPVAPALHEVEIGELTGAWNPLALKKLVGEAEGRSVYTGQFENDIIFQLGEDPLCQIVCQETTTGWIMLLNARVKPGEERKGHSSSLLLFIVGHYGRVVIDSTMSASMVELIEKLVENRIVGARIANLNTGEMKDYDPSRDAHEPMYNVQVNQRPVLSASAAPSKVWVLVPYRTPRSTMAEKVVYRGGPTHKDLLEAFATTEKLYHGTNVENLWMIMEAGKLMPSAHARGYQGPTGVCLSRSFKIALDHAQSWAGDLGYSFFEWFGLDQPSSDFGRVVLEFDRSKITQKIVAYDDFGIGEGGEGSEEEERVIGDLPLDALAAIYVIPKEIEEFIEFCAHAYRTGEGDGYGEKFRQTMNEILQDPRLKRMPV
jgi:hypothetical protein